MDRELGNRKSVPFACNHGAVLLSQRVRILYKKRTLSSSRTVFEYLSNAFI